MERRTDAAEQLLAGPFLGRDAIALGHVTRHMLRGPSWRRLFPDVYIATGTVLDHRLWCTAAALNLRGNSAIDRYSAAYLYGVDLLPKDPPVTVTVPKQLHLWRDPHIRTFRTMLPPEDVVRTGGIPVTTPLRTAFDLGRQRNRDMAFAALDALCHRHVVTIAELADYTKSRTQLHNARLLIKRLPLIDPRSESPMESRMRIMIIAAGLPVPVAQYEIRDLANRLIARVDLAWPRWRVALEYDGDYHRDPAQFRRDLARHNALREAGWTVLRFTAPDLIDHPDDTIRQARAALNERRAP